MQYLDYGLQDSWESLTQDESPIDLKLNEIQQIPWTTQPLKIVFKPNDPITKKVQENGDQFLAHGSLELGSEHYTLQRLHFHDGSEHTFNGQRLDGEIHLVYQGENDQNLVLAILCQIQEEQPEKLPLSRIYSGRAESEEVAQLFSSDLSYVRYTGSLTTPPLAPNVTWIVMTSPHPISPASKEALHLDYPENHRKLQAQNGRKIVLYQQ